MVQLKCDCNERFDAKINSYKAFTMLKEFFTLQTEKGLFSEINVKQPYFISESYPRQKYYATKWYKCNCCDCLWEFIYPDFPANGYVRKFKNNNYSPLPYKWTGLVI